MIILQSRRDFLCGFVYFEEEFQIFLLIYLLLNFITEDEADFLQESWMAFQKNRGSIAAKGPPVGRIDNVQTGPKHPACVPGAVFRHKYGGEGKSIQEAGAQ